MRTPFQLLHAGVPDRIWQRRCAVGRSVRDAFAHPEWKTALRNLENRLKEAVKNASDKGAFTFATTYSNVGPKKLYIQPPGLFKKVKQILCRDSAPIAGEPWGVLIWGARGMGKSSLALHVANEFSGKAGPSVCVLGGAKAGMP